MEFSRALSVELAVLTEALSDPEVDLQEQVRTLGETVRSTVSSFVGMRMTVVVDGYPFTVTALDVTALDVTALDVTGPVVVGASVLITLGAAYRTGATSSVVFYAATPGAFVDLAAVAAVQHPKPGAVVLDAHLDDPAGARPVSGSTGWSEVSIINQAVGVLIGGGHTPQRARVVLDARAVSTGLGVVATARAVVAAAVPQHPGHVDGSAE